MRFHAVDAWNFVRNLGLTHQTLQYAQTYEIYVDPGEAEEDIVYYDVWLIWRCNGCHSLTLEDTWRGQEWLEGKPWDVDIPADQVTLYPKRGTLNPKYFTRTPEKIRNVYKETIEAFNNDLRVLCAIGLRSLIEGICDDKEISGNRDNLEKKITSLTKLGIPTNIVENLHSFRFMGNTAVHELTAPEQDDLRLAIDIVEDLLNFVYDLDYKAQQLRGRQKQRPKFIMEDE